MNQDTLLKLLEELLETYVYVGVRCDDRDLPAGFVFDWSRHNPDRIDERDFPVYGSSEYDELEELDGTSVWFLGCDEVVQKNLLRRIAPVLEGNGSHEHAYVVVSNQTAVHPDPDDGEQLFRDCTVAYKIF